MTRTRIAVIFATIVAGACLAQHCAAQDISVQSTEDSKGTDKGWSVSVIPQPATCELSGEWAPLAADAAIACNDAAKPVAELLATQIETWAGRKPQLIAPAGELPVGTILITTDGADANLGDEGYTLDVTASGVVLKALSPQGLFYGYQTIRQLHDQPGVKPAGEQAASFLPVCHIVDKPRFSWRGMHLDVSRHFMPVSFVKRFLDLLAYHKMNVFHWHLTDDQGWRIQIDKYPALTEIAAWRDENGKRYGGFYTKDQVREVLAYAKERYITVLPEIEMPGHTQAALAAYPKLSCTGGPFEVVGKSGIRQDVFCAGNDATFNFLENVLGEVCNLFPNQYIHIGGDECPKKRWEACGKCQARIKQEDLANEHELQSYFIRRIEKFLNERGKRLVGWDEILEGGLAPDATVMSWRGTEGGITAANEGHDVIMCPVSHCYFDYRQSDAEDERGAKWAPVLDLETVYAYEPVPSELNAEKAKHVLGGQGNLWTEQMNTPADVEYMAFPRACALAEVLWSPAEARDWSAFQERLGVHLKRLDAMSVNYRKPER
ncbi:MAG: beta-N-acetylhexosaminidase [Phycisphaerales bacterium]|nr:beta-N-acetylhexosaminidase [Phycisphaerales bacterium]